jgi:hypothetical protein
MPIAGKVPMYVRLICAGILMFIAGVAHAGTNGKIMGKVVDAAGEPLPGVAVTITGTRLGATSDPDGRYFIMQVSPGAHEVRAQLIGYRVVNVTNVRVSADLTTQTDFSLHEEALEVGAMTVVAKRPDIEKDVTSSQAIIDGARTSEMPVSQILDMLAYEPGISVSENNELQIRGGGPSEVRFQVDGMERVDVLTRKAHTKLNQVLVSEVTVLTGGFNAEYGNVRSGMINAVLKDGTERRFGLPWIAGSVKYAPAQQKHFGPGAYDSDQYDYWIMSSQSPLADTALTRPIYWPELYEATRVDTAFMKNSQKDQYKVFSGWPKMVGPANFAGLGKGAYGTKNWTPEALRTAWEYESNMDEVAWGYSHEPDMSLDLAMGWALPGKLGGIVAGYTYSKEMTVVPALRPHYKDQLFETKLTLTPTDQLKIALRYAFSKSSSTGGGSKDVSLNANPELAESGVRSVTGGDPSPLRSFSDISSSLTGTSSGNNKLNLSFNQPLDGDYQQVGGSGTYTLSAKTFFNASLSWSETTWKSTRDLPRVNVYDFDNNYQAPALYGYHGWLGLAGYRWKDSEGSPGGDPPTSYEEAIDPARVILRPPFSLNVYPSVPTEGVYITKDIEFIGKDGQLDTAHVVSPQGWIQDPYKDMSGIFGLGGGGHVNLRANSSQIGVKGDLTHVLGTHMIKAGVELMTAELDYHSEQSSGVFGLLRNSEVRDYGGEWPTPRPNYLGFFVQDKYESDGMIANVGLRIERFDGGYRAFMYDDLFYKPLLSADHMKSEFYQQAEALGWKTDEWGLPLNHYEQVMDSLDVAPEPWDIINAIEYSDAKQYWRVAPRFGIAHPVTDNTKFFFNFGHFYSMQKSALMYGFADAGRPGVHGGVAQNGNPSLRPAKTTMYEVGVERVFPFSIVATFRGYAKYNVDQPSQIRVEPNQGLEEYWMYRNGNYEDIKGGEIKITRTAGRFVNGWMTFERFNSRTGNVGLSKVSGNELTSDMYRPYVTTKDPKDRFQLGIVLRTPSDWGQLRGNWALTFIEDYHSGGETIYNPNLLQTRELDDEYFLPIVDYWNSSIKLSRAVHLHGRRSIMFFMDISNVFNTKRLNGSGISDVNEYKQYIFEHRRDGEDLKYGDLSTFGIFTEPWRDANGRWQPPVEPRNEWLLYLYPRYYRFGISFSL